MVSSLPPPVSRSAASRLTRAAIFLGVTMDPWAEAEETVRGVCADLSSLPRGVGFRNLEGQLSCVTGFGAPRPAPAAVLIQAAHALGDGVSALRGSRSRNERQRNWLFSRSRQAAPQALTAGLTTAPDRRRRREMTKRFKVGDHVRWNSEAGHVSGTIIAVHTSDFDYKGHTHHASEDEPQYEIRSDKTDHVAAHKGSALTLA